MKRKIAGLLSLVLMSTMMLPLGVSAESGGSGSSSSSNGGLGNGSSNNSSSTGENGMSAGENDSGNGETSSISRVYGVDAVKLGDINLDGKVDVIDLIFLKKHCLGIKPITDEVALRGANVYQDENLNAVDLVYMKKHCLGIEELKSTSQPINKLIKPKIEFYLDNSKQFKILQESYDDETELILQNTVYPEVNLSMGIDENNGNTFGLYDETYNFLLGTDLIANTIFAMQLLPEYKETNINYEYDRKDGSSILSTPTIGLGYNITSLDDIDISVGYNHDFKSSGYTDFNNVADTLISSLYSELAYPDQELYLADYNAQENNYNLYAGEWNLREVDGVTQLSRNNSNCISYANGKIKLAELPIIDVLVDNNDTLYVNDVDYKSIASTLESTYNMSLNYDIDSNRKINLIVDFNKAGITYNIWGAINEDNEVVINKVTVAILRAEDTESVSYKTQFTNDELSTAELNTIVVEKEDDTVTLEYTDYSDGSTWNFGNYLHPAGTELYWTSKEVAKLDGEDAGPLYTRISNRLALSDTPKADIILSETYDRNSETGSCNKFYIERIVDLSENKDENTSSFLGLTNLVYNSYTTSDDEGYINQDSDYVYINIHLDGSYEIGGFVCRANQNGSLRVNNSEGSLEIRDNLIGYNGQERYHNVILDISDSDTLLKDTTVSYTFQDVDENGTETNASAEFIPSEIINDCYYN